MSVKERIKKYIKNQKTSISSFEKSISASNGYINSISKSIGADKMLSISREYSNLNIDWLLTGEGEMLKPDNSIQLQQTKTVDSVIDSQEIPLYDTDVTAGVVSLFKNPQASKPIDTIKIPNMPKCDGAITITGDSMYPLVKSGDLVFYKTILDLPNSIFYGNMYIVSINMEGDELVMLKYVQKGKDENHLLLVSENKHHADKEIHIKNINGIALVKGNVRFNFTT